MAIADYLSNLIKLRDSLKTTLTGKGIDTGENSTLSSLIPMVENVSGGSAAPIEKALYRFGVLSDIHLKDANYGVDEENMYDTADSLNDYIRALTFFKNNGADFVGIAGDIVANSRTYGVEEENAIQEWFAEIQLFRQYNDTYFTGKPVYATTGNHDAAPYGYASGAAGKGLDLVVPSTVYGDGTKNSENVWEEVVGRPIRFTFEQGNDVFIFFPMYYWNYISFCRSADEKWLKSQLEANTDKRVFLFFHLPLNNTYDIGMGSEAMEAERTVGSVSKLVPLINSYPNVIWFTGHSHFNLWREGGIQPDGVTPHVNPNTYQSGDSMTMIHCPSCAFIRDKNASGSTVRDYPGSQGLMVDVFTDRVIVKGIDFTQGAGGAFIPKATYVINAK